MLPQPLPLCCRCRCSAAAAVLLRPATAYSARPLLHGNRIASDPGIPCPCCRLTECLNYGPEYCYFEAQRRIRKEEEEEQQAKEQQELGQPGGRSAVQRVEAALRHFALLQWLWFDERCQQYAQEVGQRARIWRLCCGRTAESGGSTADVLPWPF